MPAAERSVIAESPLPSPAEPVFTHGIFPRGAHCRPRSPARGTKAQNAKHPMLQYLSKSHLTAFTQRRPFCVSGADRIESDLAGSPLMARWKIALAA